MNVMYIHQFAAFSLERILSWLKNKSKKESIKSSHYSHPHYMKHAITFRESK